MGTDFPFVKKKLFTSVNTVRFHSYEIPRRVKLIEAKKWNGDCQGLMLGGK